VLVGGRELRGLRVVGEELGAAGLHVVLLRAARSDDEYRVAVAVRRDDPVVDLDGARVARAAEEVEHGELPAVEREERMTVGPESDRARADAEARERVR